MERVLIEAYLKLLDFEGRLPKDELKCLICSNEILDNASLLRAFQTAHISCIFSNTIDVNKLKYLFNSKSTTTLLDENEINKCFFTLMEGL